MMENEVGVPENPPAFPSERHEPIRGGGYYRHDVPGMSLRDWFAGQAMAAQLTGVVGSIGGQIGAYAVGDCNAVIVDRAYTIADVMLREREKRGVA